MTKEETTRAARDFPGAKPVYLNKLMEAGLERSAIAAMMGCSRGVLDSAVNNGEWRLVNELAAQGLYERKYGDKKKKAAADHIAVVTLSSAHMPTITSLVENLGGKIHIL